jgi:hypothetical protein
MLQNGNNNNNNDNNNNNNWRLGVTPKCTKCTIQKLTYTG